MKTHWHVKDVGKDVGYELLKESRITNQTFVAYNDRELLVLHGYHPGTMGIYRVVAGFKERTYTEGSSVKTDVQTIPEENQDEIRKFLAKQLSGNICFWSE